MKVADTRNDSSERGKLTTNKEVREKQRSKNEGKNQTPKSRVSDEDLRNEVQNILSAGIEPSLHKRKQAAPEDGPKRPKNASQKAAEPQPKVRHSKTNKTTSNKFSSETTIDSRVELSEVVDATIASKIKFTSMLAKPGKKWYEQLPGGTQTAVVKNKPEVVLEKQQLAQALLQHDKALYKRHTESRSRRSEMQWVQTVLSKGTLADKVAAHTLLIQDSPVHNLSSIDALISMVSPKGKKECLMAMDGLKDLFLSDLLKPDEKLRTFAQRPLEELGPITDAGAAKKLLLWHFEDLLKHRYVTFLDAVEKVSFDQVDKMKQRAVACMFHLIAYNPEQEQRLLERLVNKLGDRINSVASRAAHHLTQLAGQHPLIKPAVVSEVERLLYRPNITPKAQYYALCFLSQLLLSNEEAGLARLLVRLYFAFFKKCVHSGEADPRTLRVLLTGVNRAFPYTRSNDPDGESTFLNDHLDVVFRVVHLGDFNVSVQALMLLFQVLDTRSSLSDRFFGALYRKLLDPALEHSHFQAMFLNLIYQALKKDTETRRIKAFLKRLLQGCMYQAPHIICGVMVLISELLKSHPKLLEPLPSSLIASSFSAPPKTGSEFDEDEDEHYEDAPSDSDLEDTAEVKAQQPVETVSHKLRCSPASAKKGSTASWVHSTLGSRKCLGREPRSYDPLARNPLYCGAEYTAPWELHHLSRHHHPSVALFAKHVLSGWSLSYPGDPLQDFTLPRFLDRFVYRNPKKPAVSENEGRAAADSVFGKRRQYQPIGMRKLPVLSRDYLNQTPQAVPPEEKFLYKYLQQTSGPQKKKKKHRETNSDAESVASDDVERLLDLCEPGIDKELDFAGDFASSKKKGKKSVLDDSEGSEDELSVELDGDEEGIEGWEDDGEFQDAFQDFEDDIAKAKQKGNIKEEDIEFSDDDEFGIPSMGPKRKGGRPTGGGKKEGSFSLNGILASAEEFSHLLDENATSGVDTSSAKALSNKDNAGVKQLKWEMDRDAWIHGRDWRSRKRKQSGRKKAGKFGGQGKRKQT